MLRASEAAQSMARFLLHYVNDALDRWSDAMAVLGPVAIPPCLELLKDTTLGWYPRVMASSAAVKAAGDDADWRSHVAEQQRTLLSSFILRAQELTDDEVQVGSFMVSDLSDLADPLARNLIVQAFQAG